MTFLVNLSSEEESFSDQMKDLSLLFITLILQVLQAIVIATFNQKRAIRYLLDCNKNQASPGLSCNKKCKINNSSIT